MSELPKTLHDLAADWSWLDNHVGFRVGRGSVVWENAQYNERSRYKNVQISRIVVDEKGLRQVTGYGDPDAIVTLIPKSTKENGQ